MFKTLTQTIAHLKKKRIFLHAGSITFATLFSLIPMLSIFFMLLSWAGIAEPLVAQFKAFIVTHLFSYGAAETHYIFEFIDNIQNMNPTLIFFWLTSCILLLYSIEDSINDLFDINRRRSLKLSLLMHVILMLIIPFILIASFIINHYVAGATAYLLCSSSSSYACQSIHLLPITTDWLLCLLLYGVFPAKQVSFKWVMITSIFTSILLYIAKMLVVFYFEHSATYFSIYGAVSSIPIFMTVIYVMWYIIFLGAALCHKLEQQS